jgi:hypothetical protein
MGDIDTSLDALYNINKHAKKYAELGTENYRKGKKTTAKANSNKKKALYAVKEHVLSSLIDSGDYDRIVRHTIRGDPFWCVYFVDSGGEEWSFHSPTENLYVDEELVSDEPEQDLEDFEVGSEKERSTESLKASLLHLESEFGVNANDHLPDQYLYYGFNRHFIGWKYLGEEPDEPEQETLA